MVSSPYKTGTNYDCQQRSLWSGAPRGVNPPVLPGLLLVAWGQGVINRASGTEVTTDRSELSTSGVAVAGAVPELETTKERSGSTHVVLHH